MYTKNTNRVIDKKNSVYLHPGEAYITNKSRVVYTVLGSCIAITMHVPRLKISAIVHSMLPKPKDTEDHVCGISTDRFKYISCTFHTMLESFKGYGAKPEEIEIKVFGGANLLTSKERMTGNNTIGRQNINMINEIIAKEKLKVTAMNVGGENGRKIYFFTDTGEIYMSRIKKNAIQEDVSIKQLLKTNA